MGRAWRLARPCTLTLAQQADGLTWARTRLGEVGEHGVSGYSAGPLSHPGSVVPVSLLPLFVAEHERARPL